MLLDSTLVEHFHGQHRQKGNGSVHAIGDDYHMRLCLENGDPVAIDIGTDLASAMLALAIDHHLITDEARAAADAATASGQVAVIDWLQQNGHITAEEAARLPTALVEDSLLRCFAGPTTQVQFVPGEGIASYDFAANSLRMRVGAEALLRTLDQRLAELQAVAKDVGGGDAVFALAESEDGGSGKLEPEDSAVLGQVDGRLTVDEIAGKLRQPSAMVSRSLRRLLGKGMVKRIAGSVGGGTTTALRQAIGGSVRRAPPPSLTQPARRRNPLLLVALAAVLLVVVGIGLLVVQYNRKQEELGATQYQIKEMVARRDWTGAGELVAKAGAAAGSDLRAKREVEGLAQWVATALESERTILRKLIAAGDFAPARSRIATLPAGGERETLMAELKGAEAESRRRTRALGAEVERLLTVGDIDGALNRLAATPPGEQGDAVGAVERWRLAQLDRARSAAITLAERERVVGRLRSAKPSGRQLEQLQVVEADLGVQAEQLRAAIVQLAARAARGAHREVAAEIARLRLVDQVQGHALAAQMKDLTAACERAGKAVQDAMGPALDAIRRGVEGEAVALAIAKLEALRREFPDVSAGDQVPETLRVLADLRKSEGKSAQERSEALAALVRPGPGGALAAALNERLDRQRGQEAAAAVALQDARRLAAAGELEGAKRRYEEITARAEWRETGVRGEAERELAELKAQYAKKTEVFARLRTAMERGEVATVQELAREAGVKTLPLLVRSHPAGAEVRIGGVVKGRTPLVLDLPAAERAEAVLDVALSGFSTAQLSAAKAEDGWLLQVRLARVAEASLALPPGTALSCAPAEIDGRLVLAGPSGATIIERAASGALAARARPWDNGFSLAQPAYAPMTKVAESWWLATRDGLVLRIGEERSERIAVPAASDLPPLVHQSALVVGRQLVVVGGRDGTIAAVDPRQAGAGWRLAPGAPVEAITLINERVLAVRRDGRMLAVSADDGVAAGEGSLGVPVIAAWAIEGGLAGCTASEEWRWDGAKLERAQLPAEALMAGPGVLVTAGGRVMVRQDKSWAEIGRVSAPVTARPQLWMGQAVVICGRQALVLGGRGFIHQAEKDLLPPAVWGERLVLADYSGSVSVYAP